MSKQQQAGARVMRGTIRSIRWWPGQPDPVAEIDLDGSPSSPLTLTWTIGAGRPGDRVTMRAEPPSFPGQTRDYQVLRVQPAGIPAPPARPRLRDDPLIRIAIIGWTLGLIM